MTRSARRLAPHTTDGRNSRGTTTWTASSAGQLRATCTPGSSGSSGSHLVWRTRCDANGPVDQPVLGAHVAVARDPVDPDREDVEAAVRPHAESQEVLPVLESQRRE